MRQGFGARIVVSGLSAALCFSASAKPSADACSLQGRYFIFFAAGVADPLDAALQPPVLRRRAADLLDAIAQGWRGDRGPLLITGHVDAGEVTASAGLDGRRAQAVSSALQARGVDALSLWTRGDGFRDPLVPEKTGPEIQNRYVAVLAPQAGFGCTKPLPNRAIIQ
jgi:hypothetical protein